MSDTPEIARINALTQNARGTWFALLTVLLFVGVTLMGVEHIDFYGVGRATQLPLIGVEVPTRLFFYAAPILMAAVYGYFHLYLIKLWDALAEARARVDGAPLGDVVAPWLVIDAALLIRSVRNVEDSVTSRTLQWPAVLLNILLAWGFGLVVLLFLWWQCMTAREPWMTAIATLSLLVSCWVGGASFVLMIRRMRGRTRHPALWLHPGLSFLCAALGVAVISTIATARTVGLPAFHETVMTAEANLYRWFEAPADAGETPHRERSFTDKQAFWATTVFDLAPIDLAGEPVVERPGDWLPRPVAREEYRATWCRRPTVDCSGETMPEAFETDWTTRRTAAIAALAQPTFNPVDPKDFRHDLFGALVLAQDEKARARRLAPDFREADLQGANLTGANLVFADFSQANLANVLLEVADLREAQLQGASLSGAQLQGADLRRAQLQGADLREAQLQGADLR